MFRKFCIIAGAAATLSSCVSAKVYKDLESRFAGLKAENQELQQELSQEERLRKQFEDQAAQLERDLAQATSERDDLQRKYTAAQTNLKNLQESYDALEANSSNALAENSKQNRELLAQLDEKQADLAAEQTRLEKMQRDLTERSRRVEELEAMIAAKDAKMRALKDAISKALVDFEGNGLTVEQRDGKVYVSLENKLLFESGSWNVGAKGKQAVNQLGSVLAQNPEIAVLIEGHTDDVPYGGNGPLKDNWDLSTKRATAIVEILR
ncbi:MAG: OmpA family protein, partial [Bacteroidota bacterium]|nr:OmpA family protein [Bacteroidota bacterium]